MKAQSAKYRSRMCKALLTRELVTGVSELVTATPPKREEAKRSLTPHTDLPQELPKIFLMILLWAGKKYIFLGQKHIFKFF